MGRSVALLVMSSLMKCLSGTALVVDALGDVHAAGSLSQCPPGVHDVLCDALRFQGKLQVVQAEVAEGLEAEVRWILHLQGMLGWQRHQPWDRPVLHDSGSCRRLGDVLEHLSQPWTDVDAMDSAHVSPRVSFTLSWTASV